MKEIKSVAEQVAELTPEQKKNIRKYELIEGGIALIIAIPLLVFFFSAFFNLNQACDAYYVAVDEFYEISTPEQDKIDAEIYNEAELALEAAQERFNFAFIILMSFAVVAMVLMLIVLFTVIKKKMPYYNVKVAFYLLTHKTK